MKEKINEYWTLKLHNGLLSDELIVVTVPFMQLL